MRRGRGAATAEEQAELRALRARADATGRELSETAAVLASRMSDAARPRTLIRRTATQAKAGAWRAARQAAGEPARLWLAAAGVAAGLILVAVAVTWQHRRDG